MIGWSYLDKRRAAIAALQDYTAMKKILAIQGVEEGTGAGMMARSFDKIDVMQQRYKHAREFMDWFEPAWCFLDDTEQLVLTEFYMRDSLRSGATARLQIKLGYSERNVDRIRSRSLGKLAKLLYGE